MADVDNLALTVLQDSALAIKKNMTPFGRTFGIVMDDPNGYAFYRIVYIDELKTGGIPSELSGRWTSLVACQNDLTAYLRKQWAFSDAKKEKASKPLANTQISQQGHNAKSAESKSATVQ